MSLIEAFCNPPKYGFVTVCEKNAQLLAFDVLDSRAKELAPFPELNAAVELMRASWSKESARAAFVEHSDSARKQLLKAWFEHGLTGILDEIAYGQFAEQTPGMRFIAHPARFALWFVRWINSMHGFLFPHLALSNGDLISEFSTNPMWKDGFVRCFAWHPHVPEFAIAMKDDFVHIRSLESNGSLAVERTLKHKLQKGVADIAWKPLSSSILAVACQSCVLIWKIDPLSMATHLWSSAVQTLTHPGHCPVISIAWCPDEGLLVSASPTDTSILVWNVAMDDCVPLKRFGSGGSTFLKWSPDGSKLFSACPSSVFRIWECVNWTCQKWTKLLARCQSACWSPDGKILLFTLHDEEVIYSLTFQSDSSSPTALTKTQISAIKVSAVNRDTETGLISLGGPVQDMAWDSNGERLAVSFMDPSAQFVAIFQTSLETIFEIIPIGFIRGRPDETATILSFRPKFVGGSLLTIVWSSGRIAHIPLYYAPRRQISDIVDPINSVSTVNRPLFTKIARFS